MRVTKKDIGNALCRMPAPILGGWWGCDLRVRNGDEVENVHGSVLGYLPIIFVGEEMIIVRRSNNYRHTELVFTLSGPFWGRMPGWLRPKKRVRL